MGVDGSGGRTIARGLYPAWTPANDSILYTDILSGALYLIAADGTGTPRQLTAPVREAHVYGRISPDGRKVLYTAITGHANESTGKLTILDLATGESTMISERAWMGFWLGS